MGVTQCFGYIGATVWLIVSTLVFAILLAVYSPHVKSLFYPQTTCTIQDAVYTTQYRCECGKDCRSLYPCLAVHADINSSMIPEKLRVWPYRVFLDDWKYIDALKADPDTVEVCFFQVCYPDSLKNRDHVELCRQSQARPGDVYPCYFDPDHVTNGAFFHRSIQWSFAFHVLAWPAFSVIGSVSMCIYISYRKHRKSRLKKKNHSASNDARSQALLRTPVANGPSPRIATTV